MKNIKTVLGFFLLSVCSAATWTLPQISAVSASASSSTDSDHPVLYSIDSDVETSWSLSARETEGWAKFTFNGDKRIFGLSVASFASDNVHISCSYRDKTGAQINALSALDVIVAGYNEFVDLSFDEINTHELIIHITKPEDTVFEVEEIRFYGENAGIRESLFSPDALQSGSSTSYFAPEQLLVDGNPETYWMTESTPEWEHISPSVLEILKNRFTYNRTPVNSGEGYVLFSFDEEIPLRSIRVYETGQGKGFYDLEVFNGISWITVEKDRDLFLRTGWHEVSLYEWPSQAMMISKVRLSVENLTGDEAGGIGELEFWGDTASVLYEPVISAPVTEFGDDEKGFSWFNWSSDSETPVQIISAVRNGETNALLLNGRQVDGRKIAQFHTYSLFEYQPERTMLLDGTNFIEISNSASILQLSLRSRYPQSIWAPGTFLLNDGILFSGDQPEPVLAELPPVFSKRIEFYGITTDIPFSYSYMNHHTNGTEVPFVLDENIVVPPISYLNEEITRIASGEPAGDLREIRVVGSPLPDGFPGGVVLSPGAMAHLSFQDIGHDVLLGQCAAANQDVFVNGVQAQVYYNIFWIPLNDIDLPDAGIADVPIRYVHSSGRENTKLHRFIIDGQSHEVTFDQAELEYTLDDEFVLSGRANGSIQTMFINGEEFPINGMTFANTLNLDPGLNIFNIEIQNTVNDMPEHYRQQRVVRITEPLSVTIDEPKNAAVDNASQITVAGSVSTSGEVQVTINNEQVPVFCGMFSCTYHYPAEGNQTYTVRAVDSFGRSESKNVSVTIDRTAPEITLEVPAENQLLTQSMVEFSGFSRDANGSWAVIDGKSAAVENEFFSLQQFYEDGIHNIPVYSVDAAGNNSAVVNRTIVVDTTPPGEFVIDGLSEGWTNQLPTISFVTSDDTSGIDHYEISINGNDFFTVQSPYHLEGVSIEEQTVTVIVRAVDTAGWSTTAEGEFSYDPVSPDAPVDLGDIPGWDHTSLEWSIEDESVTGFQIERYPSWAGGPLKDCSHTAFEDTEIEFGIGYEYRVRAIDRAGNIGLFSPWITSIAGEEIEPVEESDVTVLRYDETELYIPEDSLSEEVASITITRVESSDLEEAAVTSIHSPIFEYNLVDEEGNAISDEIEFEKDFVGSISYDDSAIPDGYPEEQLGVYYFDTEWGRWIELPHANVDPEKNIIMFTSHHFSDYSVQATPVQELTEEEIADIGYSPVKNYAKHETLLVSPQSGSVSTSVTDLVIPNPNGFDLVIKRRYDYGTAQRDYRYESVSPEEVEDGYYAQGSFENNGGDDSGDEETDMSTWVLPYLNDQGDYGYSMGKGWRLDLPYARNSSRGTSIVLPGGSSISLWEMEKVGEFTWLREDLESDELDKLDERILFFEYHRSQHIKLRVKQELKAGYKFGGNGIQYDYKFYQPDSYTLIMNDGTRYELDGKGRTTTMSSADGLDYVNVFYVQNSPNIDYMIDKVGHRVDFTYTDDDYPYISSIIYQGLDADNDGTVAPDSSDGRSITYTQTDGNLTAVSDAGGREWRYSYASYGINAYQAPVSINLTAAVDGLGLAEVRQKTGGVRPEPTVIIVKPLEEMECPGIGNVRVEYEYHTLHDEVDGEKNYFPRLTAGTVYIKNDSEETHDGNMDLRRTEYEYTFTGVQKNNGDETPYISQTIEIDGARTYSYFYEPVELPLYRWGRTHGSGVGYVERRADNDTIMLSRISHLVKQNSHDDSEIFESEHWEYADSDEYGTNVYLAKTHAKIRGTDSIEEETSDAGETEESDETETGDTETNETETDAIFPQIIETIEYDGWGNRVYYSSEQSFGDVVVSRYDAYRRYVHQGTLPESTNEIDDSAPDWKTYSDVFTDNYTESTWYDVTTGEIVTTTRDLQNDLLLAECVVNYTPQLSTEGIVSFSETTHTEAYSYYEYNQAYGQMTGSAQWSDSDGKWFIKRFTYNNAEDTEFGTINTVTYSDSNHKNDAAFSYHTTSFSYDTNGYLASKTEVAVQDADEGETEITTEYTFDPVTGWLEDETDPRDYTTSYIYDSLGRVTDISHPADPNEGDVLSHIVYDDDKNELSATVTDPENDVVVYRFNNLGDLIEMQKGSDTEQAVTKIHYNRWGQISAIIDPNAGDATTGLHRFTTYYEYDGMGRKTRIQYPYETGVAPAKTFAFDYNTNTLTTTDEEGRTAVVKYDMFGRVTESYNAISGDSTYNQEMHYYDGLGNEWIYRDQNNMYTVHTYDSRGLKTKTEFPEEGFYEWNSETAAEPSSVTTSPIKTFIYDYASRLTEEAMDLPGQGNAHTDLLRQITTYDGLGRVIRTLKTNAAVTVAANAIPETNILQQTTQYWDDNGNLKKVIDPDSRITEYTYTERNKIETTTIKQNSNDTGYTTEYSYYKDDMIHSITDPRGTVTDDDLSDFMVSYTYNSLKRLTAATLPPKTTGGARVAVTLDYDQHGNLIKRIDPDGKVTVIGYTPRHWRETVSVGEGSVVDGLNTATALVTKYSYDDAGNAVSIIDPRNNETRQVFDELNRLIEVRYPEGNREQYTYDERGNRTEVIDGEGNTTFTTYDAYDRIDSIQLPGTNGTETILRYYDRLGNLVKETNSIGNSRWMQYNDLSRLISEKDAEGFSTSYTWTDFGNLAASTDKNGNTAAYTYNVYNKVLTESVSSFDVPSLASRAFTYDAAGILKSATVDTAESQPVTTDYNKNGDTYHSDAYGRILRATDAIGSSTGITMTYDYDLGDRISHIGYAGGETVDYSYDALGQLQTMAGSGGNYLSSITWQDGLLDSFRMANTILTSFDYDDNGRLSALDVEGGEITAYSFSYDNANNITSLMKNGNANNYIYDEQNRLIYAGLTGSFSVASNGIEEGTGLTNDDYFGLNRINFENTAIDEEIDIVSFDYSARSIGMDLGDQYLVSRIRLQSNAFGRTRVTPESIEVYTSDTNTPGSYHHRTGDEVVVNRIDGAASETFDIRFSLPVSTRYIKVKTLFDDRNENWQPVENAEFENTLADMIKVFYAIGSRNEHYTYDAQGNRTQETVTLRSTETRSYIYYPHTSRLASDGRYVYKYDKNGNLTAKGTAITISGTIISADALQQTQLTNNLIDSTIGDLSDSSLLWGYEFDAFNRLVKVLKNTETIATYTYNAGNLRIQKERDNIVTRYGFGLEGELLYERTDADDDGTFEKEVSYVYALGKIFAMNESQNGTTERFYLHTDHLGSVIAATSEEGDLEWSNDYTPFGEQAEIDSSRFALFTAKQLDEDTGLYYFNARWYDPGIGRFVSEDPVRDGLAWYGYANGNPLRFVDPTGLVATSTPYGTFSDERGWQGDRMTNLEIQQEYADYDITDYEFQRFGPFSHSQSFHLSPKKATPDEGGNFVESDGEQWFGPNSERHLNGPIGGVNYNDLPKDNWQNMPGYEETYTLDNLLNQHDLDKIGEFAESAIESKSCLSASLVNLLAAKLGGITESELREAVKEWKSQGVVTDVGAPYKFSIMSQILARKSGKQFFASYVFPAPARKTLVMSVSEFMSSGFTEGIEIRQRVTAKGTRTHYTGIMLSGSKSHTLDSLDPGRDVAKEYSVIGIMPIQWLSLK